jgi:hypothetical protein
MTEESIILPSVRADAPDIEDKLGFAPYAKTISQIILDDNVETPLTIGIFGGWGSGKTTLMRMVEHQILEAALQTPPPTRLTLPIWFNAWLYSKEEVLWRALLAQVVTAVGRMDVPTDPKLRQEKNEKLEALKARLYRTLGGRELGSLSFAMADLLQSSGSGAQLTLTLQQGFDLLEKVASVTSKSKHDEDVAESKASEAEQEQLKKMMTFRQQVRQATTDLEQGRLESLDKFRAEFDKLMVEYVKDEGHLVVFVDDLDRCLPEKAVEVLEAIKLFLDVNGCIFVLAIDQTVVERGIQLRYGELGKATEDNGDDVIDGGRYLEKIVQIPFVLPPISPRTMGQYVATLAPDLPDPECGNVFAQGLEANPRHVKRAINIFSLLWRLAQNKSELTALVTPVRLAKLVVLQQRHEDLYELLRKNPTHLRDWEANLRKTTKADGKILDRSQLAAELQDVDEEELLKLHGLLTMHDPTRADMNFTDLKPEDVHAYVYLASAVEETVTPVQQVVGQTAVPPTPTEDLTKKIGDDLIEADEDKAALEVELPKEVAVRSGLEEARLSFVTATVFRDLDKQLSQFDAAQFDSEQGKRMVEVLGPAGWQLYDQIIPPDDRTTLEERLVEPMLLRVAEGRGEERIPWEIVYDGLPPSPTSQTKRKMQSVQETAVIDFEHFWGFKHVIERSGSGYGRDIKAFETQVRPVIFAHIGSDTPQLVEVEQSLRDQFKAGADGYQPLGSPDEFFHSLSIASDSPRIYVLRTRAGIEQGETWIGFGFEETDRTDLKMLRQALTERFTESELRTLAFDLDLDYDYFPGKGKSDKAREIIAHFERRNKTPQLIQYIEKARPDILSKYSLSKRQTRLMRQQLESWSTTAQLNAILILDVDTGLVQAEDWSAWLALFYRMGFAGVVAPTIALDLSRSWPFMQRFIQGFLEGAAIGEALRDARRWFWLDHYDPSGLFYAHFGSADLRLNQGND